MPLFTWRLETTQSRVRLAVNWACGSPVLTCPPPPGHLYFGHQPTWSLTGYWVLTDMLRGPWYGRGRHVSSQAKTPSCRSRGSHVPPVSSASSFIIFWKGTRSSRFWPCVLAVAYEREVCVSLTITLLGSRPLKRNPGDFIPIRLHRESEWAHNPLFGS